MQNVILTFFSRPTHLPLKTSKLIEQNLSEKQTIYFSVLLPFKRCYACTGKKAKHIFTAICNGSEPVVYQTKNTAREIKQQY